MVIVLIGRSVGIQIGTTISLTDQGTEDIDIRIIESGGYISGNWYWNRFMTDPQADITFNTPRTDKGATPHLSFWVGILDVECCRMGL